MRKQTRRSASQLKHVCAFLRFGFCFFFTEVQLLAHRGSIGVFRLLRVSVSHSVPIVGQLTESVESSFLIHQGGYHDLFVCP